MKMRKFMMDYKKNKLMAARKKLLSYEKKMMTKNRNSMMPGKV
jgi:hypothetical protein